MWHENNGLVLDGDYDEFINEGRNIAKKHNVYLLMTPTSIDLNNNKDKNQAVLIDNKGNVCYTYDKYKIVSGDIDVAGDGKIKYADTPYGRIGSAICFDADFPSYIIQAGKDNIDIMLIPSSDWKAIDPAHTQMASFRSIENGFSMVRQAQKGACLSTDYLGRTISSMDFFNIDDKVMISHVPVKGTNTIYSCIGDVFTYLCILTFCLIVVKSLLESKKHLQK